MKSCLTTNQVWEACNGDHLEPPMPKPRKDMIKQSFLLLLNKTIEGWNQYDIVNKEYKIWAKVNRKATTLIKRYVNDVIQSELKVLKRFGITLTKHINRTSSLQPTSYFTTFTILICQTMVQSLNT